MLINVTGILYRLWTGDWRDRRDCGDCVDWGDWRDWRDWRDCRDCRGCFIEDLKKVWLTYLLTHSLTSWKHYFPAWCAARRELHWEGFAQENAFCSDPSGCWVFWINTVLARCHFCKCLCLNVHRINSTQYAHTTLNQIRWQCASSGRGQ